MNQNLSLSTAFSPTLKINKFFWKSLQTSGSVVALCFLKIVSKPLVIKKGLGKESIRGEENIIGFCSMSLQLPENQLSQHSTSRMCALDGLLGVLSSSLVQQWFLPVPQKALQHTGRAVPSPGSSSQAFLITKGCSPPLRHCHCQKSCTELPRPQQRGLPLLCCVKLFLTCLQSHFTCFCCDSSFSNSLCVHG